MIYSIDPLSDEEMRYLNELTKYLGENALTILFCTAKLAPAMEIIKSAAEEKISKESMKYREIRNLIERLKCLEDKALRICSIEGELRSFMRRINYSTEEKILDEIWDEEIQNLRPATSDEQTINDYRREVQYKFQQQMEAAPNSPILEDETERDDIWDEEEQTLRPATKEEQALIDSAREAQYHLQLKLPPNSSGKQYSHKIGDQYAKIKN